MVDQNTQTSPSTEGKSEVSSDKIMGILSYLSILFLVPLLAVRNRSAFLNCHINQGIGLFLVSLIGSIILSFVHAWALITLWRLLMVVLVILGIVNVVRNETKTLPIIGNWFHLIK